MCNARCIYKGARVRRQRFSWPAARTPWQDRGGEWGRGAEVAWRRDEEKRGRRSEQGEGAHALRIQGDAPAAQGERSLSSRIRRRIQRRPWRAPRARTRGFFFQDNSTGSLIVATKLLLLLLLQLFRRGGGIACTTRRGPHRPMLPFLFLHLLPYITTKQKSARQIPGKRETDSAASVG
ncbi:unnamed protein product [Prorocentrum cordatum]|uniref:Uncharacterized protein n=1 Tax=Prorocentrum cordatum TaxID=2364126 RepID=A0ABN9VHW7_9DINO|nr:unnamed protein product [Polarella glacialis]